jgi:hypothetical protein
VPHLRRDWAHPCHICAATGLSQELIAYALSIPEAFATAMLKRLDANGDEQLDASELKPLPAGIKKVPDSSGRLLAAYCMRIVPRVSASTDRCRRTAACVRAHARAHAGARIHARSPGDRSYFCVRGAAMTAQIVLQAKHSRRRCW